MRTIDRMVAGFRSFRAIYYEQRPERVASLVEGGQKPEILLVACSDSRVDPAILMNAEPGELFVVRNVAALVPPYAPDGHYHGTSAALEYAVRDLKVQDIIVLAHSSCGGVSALVAATKHETMPDREFIQPWMSMMAGAVGDEEPAKASQDTLRQSIRNLRSFPFVQNAADLGYLNVHGWWFDMKEGALYRLNEDDGQFVRIE
ncbi:carbonic anhydrase [Insolitispirillum peregrinum]|uniref:carbonic anhydrase n=1 Tax=Insolitispirillum peregrinum TaxID=80876 RepID=A0A1N7MJU0_9PROT|nr:carbonic anhydrase [Insolitispirillum peregrinum]SIS86300.1 carbonic anhydrase [Insolitispirillum peregrinum]